MATRRRSSAVKSTTAKKSPRSVVTKKTTVTSKSVNKVTPIEEVKVAETAEMIEIKLPKGTNLKKRPMNVENKVTETPVKVKPEVKLISRDLYLQDVKNRWQIHQFETQQLWEDLVKGYNFVSPYVTKSIEYVTSAYNKEFGTKTSS